MKNELTEKLIRIIIEKITESEKQNRIRKMKRTKSLPNNS